jgi:hypothetical protein
MSGLLFGARGTRWGCCGAALCQWSFLCWLEFQGCPLPGFTTRSRRGEGRGATYAESWPTKCRAEGHPNAGSNWPVPNCCLVTGRRSRWHAGIAVRPRALTWSACWLQLGSDRYGDWSAMEGATTCYSFLATVQPRHHQRMPLPASLQWGLRVN